MSQQIYRREESPTQTCADAIDQANSGEVWGRSQRIGGLFPHVKAYVGHLHGTCRGIEFTTHTLPDKWSSSPFEAKWYHPQTPGVFLRQRGGVDYAAIKASVTNKQP